MNELTSDEKRLQKIAVISLAMSLDLEPRALGAALAENGLRLQRDQKQTVAISLNGHGKKKGK